jgi:RNA polymerase subunit RPABC4/transcription elongation factor Spt4
MGLVSNRECPFCKRPARSDATVCPHCTRDIPTEEGRIGPLVIVAILVVVVGVVAALLLTA